MCECHKGIDEKLAEYNAGLTFNLLGPFRAVLHTYKLDDKKRGKKPPYVLATYCPFCGAKYPDEAPACAALAQKG